MRPRVLLTTPLESRPGGVSEYLRVIKPYLAEHVDYFTVGSRTENESATASLMRLINDSRNFARTLRGASYDVIHLNPSIGFKALIRDGVLLLIAKALHRQVVVFAHGWDLRCLALLRSYFSQLFRWTFGKADAFIVLGRAFESAVRQLGYRREVFLAAAPLGADLFAAADGCTRRSHGDNAFNLLFLSRVEREKGVFEALDTYGMVKQSRDDITLTVAGSGAALSDAREYASQHGLENVTFVGHVTGHDKYQLFQQSDAFLFPSYGEGLPLAVLEAMAFGLPVVTTAVGGLNDFFMDGTMGYSVPTADPKAFAGFVMRLIDDPELCSRISDFNRQYARTHFTAPDVAAGIERIYRLVLENAH